MPWGSSAEYGNSEGISPEAQAVKKAEKANIKYFIKSPKISNNGLQEVGVEHSYCRIIFNLSNWFQC